MGLIDDPAIREKTKRTSATLFKGVKNEVGFEHWKRFDKGLARDLSLFFTGVMYSREVISQKQRELCAVAALKYYRTGFDVTMKADATPVTQADQGAEQAIREVLGRAFPAHGFLGEELGAVGDQQCRWIIDPIDGTKNFVKHVPIWATLIALEEAGELTVGVIHNPVTGELLAARRGLGARLNGEPVRAARVSGPREATLLP